MFYTFQVTRHRATCSPKHGAVAVAFDVMGVWGMSISPKLRWQILSRDSFTCQYCGSTAPNVKLEVDHIEPRSRGGSDDALNLITACEPCNRGKSDADLADPLGITASDVLYLIRRRGHKPSDAVLEVNTMRASVLDGIEQDLAIGWGHFFYDRFKKWPPGYEMLRLVERFSLDRVKHGLEVIGEYELHTFDDAWHALVAHLELSCYEYERLI